MSNDKTEATYHGRRRAFLVGDWVYVTQLPEFDHRLGQVAEIVDSMRPYTVRFGADEYAVFDWLALTPATSPEHLAGWAPGNLQHHLISDHGVPPHRVPYDGPLDAIHAEAHTFAAETTGEHIFHKLGDDLYQDWADDPAPKHLRPLPSWGPTPGELGLALGIMAFIVLLFIFFVFFYRGW